jgi:Asp-tRNA(Asn)/Glu-tRNA(Gln) amidotransferase C subunit
VDAVAALARLQLTDQRKPVVAAALDMVNDLIGQLDHIDLADTPPATGYNPRWL